MESLLGGGLSLRVKRPENKGEHASSDNSLPSIRIISCMLSVRVVCASLGRFLEEGLRVLLDGCV